MGDDEGGEPGERQIGADEAIESRISSAACQPGPVGVIYPYPVSVNTCLPTSQKSGGNLVIFPSDSSACPTGQHDIRAGQNKSPTASRSGHEESLIQTQVIKRQGLSLYVLQE